MSPLVDALAVARLTRLVTTDLITERPREALSARSDFLDDLLHCGWCTSMWCGLGVVAARRCVPKLWGPVATVLAYSEVAGLLSRVG